MNVSTNRCRPFDKDRDGLVLGEGAALFVLEAEEGAARRGADVLGYVRGYGAATDAHHMTQPSPEGYAITSAMKQALASAGLAGNDIGYLNLHGTGTKINDMSEYMGVRSVFGEAMEGLDCSSTKALTGHTLGAAGAIEAAFCLLAAAGGFLPPNEGIENPDPEMGGLKIVETSRKKDFTCAMSNSLGFGGEASSVIIEARLPPKK
jgi:3-oxoacyl-[acyl-carrier-protein] synthase II